MKTWMVRAGEGGFLFEAFKAKSAIAIGWNEIRQMNESVTIDQLKADLRKTYPDWKEGNIIASASQLYKFFKTFKIGDYVVTYDRISRNYLIGKIDSDYIYDENLMDYFHTRKVAWFKEKSRDELSTFSKNTLGSTLTIFEINPDATNDLIETPSAAKIDIENEVALQDENLDEIKDETIERANEFIKDKIANLTWDRMQDFVAGLLRAMGYITQVSPKGPDRGKDIIASPDGLGLQEPRIKVEVKHRKGQIGAPDIRSFIGSIRGEKGLYVSTGGFTREANYEAERSDKPITLLDLDGLVGISIQYYDKFDNEAKAILPLKKVYWPL